MYYVYVLYSHNDRKRYVGYSNNLRSRVKAHLNCQVAATKHRLPMELIYYEAYKGKEDATKRGWFLKSGRGRELLDKLLVHSMPG